MSNYTKMPDPESKKNQQKKGKGDAKEQRKPRQQRSHGVGDKKSEKRTEECKAAPPEKPVLEEPGPEFYKGLKRETDDILKITEDVNSKYKKKEIKSNWDKYEVPIDTYDDMEEQENLGADYEKLIQAPLSLGGHFQFKHEKSWDITTGPSLYDKYFDITANDLALALCTIPFYERNGIDRSIFRDTDIQTMEQRTSRYKHKYFKIATTESEIQDKLINGLKENYSKGEIVHERNSESEVDKKDDISFEESKLNKTEVPPKDEAEIVFTRAHEDNIEIVSKDNVAFKQKEMDESIDDIIVGTKHNLIFNKTPDATQKIPVPEVKKDNNALTDATEPKKNPVIESPEDLEKWLDDFLEE